jgi:hypothetical protein
MRLLRTAALVLLASSFCTSAFAGEAGSAKAAAKVWNNARTGKKTLDFDAAVKADADAGHNQWYQDRQAGPKAKDPNPKPIKAKFLGGLSFEEAHTALAPKYPGMNLVRDGEGKVTGLTQDINRPVHEVFPGLNEQLNGGLARNRANRIQQALKANRKLTPGLRKELAAADHADWMSSEVWNFASEAVGNEAFNNEMRDKLGFDARAIKASGKDPGSVIYDISMDKIIDFAKTSTAPVSAKFAETRSQYRNFKDLPAAEQEKDLNKIKAAFNRLLVP